MRIELNGVRLLVLLAACLLVGGSASPTWAACATENVGVVTACPVTGGPGQGLRFQIGGGLPVPAPVINPSPPPVIIGLNNIQPIPNAVALVGAKPTPSIMLPAGAFQWSQQPANVPVFTQNSMVFQVRTDFAISFPAASVTFKKGGRSGPQNAQWCPHLPPPAGTYNPSCTGPSETGAITNGIMRYTGTAAQFGGPAVGNIFAGDADVALVAAFAPGCSPIGACLAAHVVASGVSPGQIGGAFGGMGQSFPPVIANGIAIAPGGLGAYGTINAYVNNVFTNTLTNMATSWGGPWTDGMVQIQVPAALGPGETFTVTGGDARTPSGEGTISLVAGAISQRATSMENANRGWLTFTLGPEKVSVSVFGEDGYRTAAALGISAALLIGASYYLLAGRRRAR